MFIRAFFALAGTVWATTGMAQVATQSLGMEVAGLREDVRGLVQRVGELTMRIEQLERENANLRRMTSNLDSTYVTAAQLNAAVADLNRAIRAGDNASRDQAIAAIKELARDTNAAIDSVAKGMATRTAIRTEFSNDFPKEGISYTVQRGDTLSSIASKFGATVKDIQNANKISDPRAIQVGQTLFIPGAK